MNYYQKAKFLKSAARINQLPPDQGYEVAFAGRSNAGKSTAINILTGQKGLAKTSKTPGRTQLINLFTLDLERRLVDLPGYGYAEVSKVTKEQWQKTLIHYLQSRQCLRGVVLLMDSRHPLQKNDQILIEQLGFCPLHILLTKADKLSNSSAIECLNKMKKQFASEENIVSIQLFSALTRKGFPELVHKLNEWFDLLV